MEQAIKEKNWKALRFPVLFVTAIWAVHLFLYFEKIHAFTYGVYPRTLSGLTGIFSYPFIHENFQHIFNNSIPILVLGWAIFHFYKEVALKTVVYIWLISGFWLWIIGRPAYHIGASGLVYGFAAFLLLSGILRREPRVAGISLLVIFLYGSLVWGLFPIEYNISFEAHLCGTIAGLVLAYLYRNTGIQKQEFVWEEEDEIEVLQTEEEGNGSADSTQSVVVNYTFVQTEK